MPKQFVFLTLDLNFLKFNLSSRNIFIDISLHLKNRVFKEKNFKQNNTKPIFHVSCTKAVVLADMDLQIEMNGSGLVKDCLLLGSDCHQGFAGWQLEAVVAVVLCHEQTVLS